ncbi:MAG: helix-hairpin-helix domain-containing protein [Sedimentisphaerales bacterium]|nr:helix-hairpin-helix domain-containing protein [Sedimentisphaerales bacterium]
MSSKSMRQSTLKELQQIPGVGESIARDMQSIGIKSISDLKNQNPEKLYRRLCEYKASSVDRCMLYVLRCAVYYSSHSKHDPKLLKWWNWKDKE